MRNPPWSRDELVVTLDFYLRHRPSIPGKTSDEIAELSGFLQQLQDTLGGETSNTYRNTNGVYMKLMNFRRFDPDYAGAGLQRGNKDEEVVWNQYSSRPQDLRNVVTSIQSIVSSGVVVPPQEVLADDEEESDEGAILTRTHRFRERNSKLTRKKKERVMREVGKLTCEVCGFEFSKNYGDRGDGFIECHHTKPVSELSAGDKTKIADLSLVCSNCHRMIHRKRPWLSIDELRELIAKLPMSR